MRRALLVLAALAFVACVAVQFNDPDPGRWIAVYGGAAAACALEAAGLRRPVLPWGLLGVAIIWAAGLAVGIDAGSLRRGFDDEVIRELGGLLLVGAAMGGVLASRRRAAARGAGPA